MTVTNGRAGQTGATYIARHQLDESIHDDDDGEVINLFIEGEDAEAEAVLDSLSAIDRARTASAVAAKVRELQAGGPGRATARTATRWAVTTCSAAPASWARDERRRLEALYGRQTRAEIRARGLWPKSLPAWPGDEPANEPNFNRQENAR